MTVFKGSSLRFILGLATLLTLQRVDGQIEHLISAGDVSTCLGALQDSGGPAGDYGDNENHTATICPDVPGDAISLNWLICNLSPTGPNPDRIRIFDGDNTSATSLGDYTGTDLQTLIVSATTFNTSGCLTVQFISNGSGVGNFAASITCYTPCERPTAVAVMSEAVPAMVCVGEEVTFDGSGSFAAAGFNVISYTWEFDDGTSSSGPLTSHAFSEPGEYIVQLNLVDDNDCVNSNVVDLQVLVSTTPHFAGTTESLVSCIGATTEFSAVVTPVTWTGLPDPNLGSGVYLPDDVGLPFVSQLEFTQFDPGQELVDANDILSICVDMEHSYMGDLVLQVICPNGQSMFLHQQGGGGTFLGSPNDLDDDDAPVQGVCWNYCWTPSATNGTWEENSEFGATPNVMPSGEDVSGDALVPGTYEPITPFSALEGCPLNGTWTYQSTDFFGADNGFICGWSIDFDPSIIPDVTQFTPDPGTSTLDSAGWTGPSLVVDPLNPLVASSTLDTPGTYDYMFSVIDNFGCSYDTTITVTVPDIAVLDAGDPITLCSDPLPLAGEITANGPPANCTFTLTLTDGASDGWNGGASLDVALDGVTTNYTVVNGDELVVMLDVGTGDVIQFDYTAGTIWNNENSFVLTDDTGADVYASPNGPATGTLWTGVIACGGGIPFSFEWTPAAGLDDPTDPGTNVFVTEPTMFYLSTYPTGHPECAVTDSVLVSPDPSIDAGESNIITICANNIPITMLDSLGGTPDAGGTWTNSAGAVIINGEFDPTVDTDDTFTYTLISDAGCAATATLQVTVIPSEDPSCCGIVDAGEDAFSCNLSIALSATRGNTGVGNWTGPAGAIFDNAFDATTIVSMPVGSGGTHMFYWVENDGALCDLIDSVAMTFTDDYTFTPTLTDAVCFSYCDGTASLDVSGGNPELDWNYTWSNGDAGTGLNAVDGLCAGEYTLTVRDENGCEDSFDFIIGEPQLLRIDSMASKPVTCSGDCDGQVEIYDAEALEYSFDNGTTWVVDSVKTEVCEGIAQVRIKNLAGCIGTDAIAVNGPPPVVAEFDWWPRPADVEHPHVTFANLSSGSDHFDWNIADLATSNAVTPSYTFNNKVPGVYPVCLIAYNYNECSDTVCYDVEVNDALYTYIPNTFTPDGDNVNDTWWPTANIDVRTDYELLVFDRWGKIVFSTEDPYKSWLGSYQNGGEILKSDVYAYKLLFGIKDSEVRKEIMGHVTLLK